MTKSTEALWLGQCVETARRQDVEGIRFLAACALVYFHIWGHPPSGTVTFFFVVSGYLVGQSLISKLMATNGNIRKREFFVRILYRLMGPILVVTAIVFPLLLMFTPQHIMGWEAAARMLSVAGLSNTLSALGANIFRPIYFMPSMAPEWTVGVQLQTYLIFMIMFATAGAMAFKMGSRRPLWIAVCVLGAGSVAISIYAQLSISIEPLPVLHEIYHYTNPFSRLYQFIGGLTVALMLPEIRSAAQKHRRILPLLGFAGVAFIASYIAVKLAIPSLVNLGPHEILLAIGICLLIAGGTLLHEEDRRCAVNQFLAIKPISRLGKYTYAGYLIHWPLFMIASFYFAPIDFGRGFEVSATPQRISLTGAIAVVAISLIIATAIHRVFERETIRTAGNPNTGRHLSAMLLAVLVLPIVVLIN